MKQNFCQIAAMPAPQTKRNLTLSDFIASPAHVAEIDEQLRANLHKTNSLDEKLHADLQSLQGDPHEIDLSDEELRKTLQFYMDYIGGICTNFQSMYRQGEDICCPRYRITMGFPAVDYGEDGGDRYDHIDIYLDYPDGNKNTITASPRSLAQLEQLYRYILAQHEHNVKIFADFDANVAGYTLYEEEVNALGGYIIPKRPYVLIMLPSLNGFGEYIHAQVTCSKVDFTKFLNHLNALNGLQPTNVLPSDAIQ